MGNGATVTAADIARLAGVGKAAVSNWRRRYDDFPAPVAGTVTSPHFSLAEVETWLRGQGKLGEVPADERVWQRLRTSGDDLRLADAVGDLGAFLLFRGRAPGKWAELAGRSDPTLAGHLGPAVAARVGDLPGPAPGAYTPELVAVARSIAELADERGAVDTFEFLFRRYLEAYSRRLATTPPAIAELMAALADVRGGVAFDPACGTGALLVAALSFGPARLAGQELDESIARLAALRLALREPALREGAEPGGAGAAAGVAAGDSLRADAYADLRVDATLCTPPSSDRGWGYEELAVDPRWEYGLPPRGESELAWVQHALAHVRRGGRVVMLMPSAVANRRSGRRIRAELLRTGTLRAVVALGASAAPSFSAVGPHLWLLRRPDPADPLPSHVLFVDVSTADLCAVRETVERYLGEGVLQPLGPAEGEPHRSPSHPRTPHEQGAARAVPLIDLLDDDVDLTPARHLPQYQEAPGEEFAKARRGLAAAVADLERTLPDLDVRPGDPRDVPMTTVGEQLRAGALTVHQAAPRTQTTDGDLPLLTAQDVFLGRPPSGRTSARPGRVTVQPGDVVIPAVARRMVARVIVADGPADGSVLGPNLQLVRPDREWFDPDFLAAFLRVFGGGAGAVRTQSGPSRVDVRKAPFPRVPLADQRRYSEINRGLVRLEDLLRAAAEAGDAVVRLGFDGLGDGSLRPGDPA